MKRMAVYTILLLSLYSCKKNDKDQATPEPTTEHGEVREKGVAAGDAVHAQIGPAGGTLASADGRLQMEIPAGAVTKETDFTIQPITNTLPGSPGKGYRLLPEGQTFAQPVRLTFQYDDADLAATSAQMLYIAFQGSDGIWKMIPQTALDETNKTLKATTTHFSDWAIFAQYYLTGGQNELKPKGSTWLEVSSEDLLAPLVTGGAVEIGKKRAEDNPKNIKNWQFFNDGNLAVEPNQKRATYTAPAQIPSHNPVEISVEVYNVLPPGANRPTATGKVILLTRIYIVDETYFIAEVNGVSQVMTSIFYTEDDQGLFINGNINGTTNNILLFVAAHNPGIYPYNLDELPGTGVAVYNAGPGDGYVPGYTPCEGDVVTSPGYISIDKKEKNGSVEYLTGGFTATVYKETGMCPNLKIIKKTLSGKFRLIRKTE
ncbi:hypothetical protein ACTJJB_29280 [Chitinophaga sp. 22536]|uniref:hypothetical protein n=1 Tax=unclassified Chitinophaga TaxID=2619133 RepID=UPI003F86ED12